MGGLFIFLGLVAIVFVILLTIMATVDFFTWNTPPKGVLIAIGFLAPSGFLSFMLGLYLESLKPIPNYLPNNASNVRDLGNEWTAFDVEIDGKTRTIVRYKINNISVLP